MLRWAVDDIPYAPQYIYSSSCINYLKLPQFYSKYSQNPDIQAQVLHFCFKLNELTEKECFCTALTTMQICCLPTKNHHSSLLHQVSYTEFPNPPSYFWMPLTRAPLLSRIMKMMKVSNQLCSTIRKHVFLKVHQDFPSPSSILTWQHLQRCMQPGKGTMHKEGWAPHFVGWGMRYCKNVTFSVPGIDVDAHNIKRAEFQLKLCVFWGFLGLLPSFLFLN